jgi:hypothetical protein
MLATVASLERLGVGVVVVGPVPDFGDSFPRAAVSVVRPSISTPVVARDHLGSADRAVRGSMEDLASTRPGVEVIDPLDRLCGPEVCRAVEDGVWTHLGPIDLTATGARRLRPELDRVMERLLSP